MSRNFAPIAIVAFLSCQPALADPIHAAANGGYWHHDSGWIFPEKIGEFARVGIPQDVAGSEDAVAHYARVESGARRTASVDVYRATSAAAAALEARAAEPSSDTGFPVSTTRALPAKRNVRDAASALVATYFVDAGEWRVRIRMTGGSLEAMDEFVRGQRWETLGNH